MMQYLSDTVSHLLYDVCELAESRRHRSPNRGAIFGQYLDSMVSCRRRILFFAHNFEQFWYDNAAHKAFVERGDLKLTEGILMKRFIEWKDAHTHAQKLANDTKLDVAIRRTREYGRDGFNVSFASQNDSDYARAEIVRPHYGMVLP